MVYAGSDFSTQIISNLAIRIILDPIPEPASDLFRKTIERAVGISFGAFIKVF
jgi:hypothetical protein